MYLFLDNFSVTTSNNLSHFNDPFNFVINQPVKINCEIWYCESSLISASARKAVKFTGLFELASNNHPIKSPNYNLPSHVIFLDTCLRIPYSKVWAFRHQDFLSRHWVSRSYVCSGRREILFFNFVRSRQWRTRQYSIKEGQRTFRLNTMRKMTNKR
jgi:hypothetical protein